MDRENLKRYKYLKGEIRTLRGLIADLEDMAAPVAKWSDEPKAVGGVSNPVAEIVERKETLKAEYVRELHELLEMQAEIEEWMKNVKPKYRQLIRLLYVDGKTYLQTAEELGINSRTVTTWLHEVLGFTLD